MEAPSVDQFISSPAPRVGVPLGYQLTIVSESDVTASDLEGLGRTVGNAISAGGRRIGRWLAKQKPPRPADPPIHPSDEPLAADDPAPLELALVSASDLTASDHVGAGRMLGSVLSWSGTRLESWLTRTAERMGLGPSASMLRILDAILRSQSQKCPHCGLAVPLARNPARRSVAAVQEVLHLCFTGRCAGCKRGVTASAGSRVTPEVRLLVQKLVKSLQ
jgi:hypothetical protein